MTSHRAEPSHAGPEVLATYARHGLDDEEAAEVEIHLAECAHCAELVSELRLLDNAVKNWSVRGYDKAYERSCLLAALEDAEGAAVDEEWKARLRSWREDWAGRAEAAVGVLMDAGGAGSRLFLEGVDALVRPGISNFELAPAGAIRVRGTKGRTRRKLGGIDASVAIARREDHVQMTLEIDEDAAELHVRITGWPSGRGAPLLLLRKDKRCVAVLAPVAEDRALVARFRSVSEGTYVVQVEPGAETGA